MVTVAFHGSSPKAHETVRQSDKMYKVDKNMQMRKKYLHFAKESSIITITLEAGSNILICQELSWFRDLNIISHGQECRRDYYLWMWPLRQKWLES